MRLYPNLHGYWQYSFMIFKIHRQWLSSDKNKLNTTLFRTKMQYVILPQGHRLTKDLPAVNESAIFAAQVVDPVLPGSVDDDGMVSGNNRMLIQRGEVNILLYGLA